MVRKILRRLNPREHRRRAQNRLMKRTVDNYREFLRGGAAEVIATLYGELMDMDRPNIRCDGNLVSGLVFSAEGAFHAEINLAGGVTEEYFIVDMTRVPSERNFEHDEGPADLVQRCSFQIPRKEVELPEAIYGT